MSAVVENGSVQGEVDHQRILGLMRTAFESGQHSKVLLEFSGFDDISQVRGGIRVEAICLAARSHKHLGDAPYATTLVKRVGRPVWTNAKLYHHVAMALLELNQAEEAGDMLDKARALRN